MIFYSGDIAIVQSYFEGEYVKESDLRFFENLLDTRMEQIQNNINHALKDMQELQKTHASDEADHATLSSDRLTKHAINKQQAQELKEIEYAKNKIKEGRYGICEMCEEKISVQRLKVKPHAKYCIVCREIVEKQN